MIYAIFLRGINTGGMKLQMSDFKNILQDAGCQKVKTIQAAGTAVFEHASESDAAFKSEIELRLTKHIGKEVNSIVKTANEIQAIIEHGEKIKSSDEYHDYIMLTSEHGLFAEISTLHESIPFTPGERLINGSGYFVWTIRKGETLADFGSKVLGSPKYKDKLTSRNFNTIQKVWAMIKIIDV